MLALAVLVFLVVPIAELYVVIRVGAWIGAGPTILALVLVTVFGAWLVRHQGLAVWRQIRTETRAGTVPAAAVFDGALILAAGVLLLAPGFLTDAIGLVLLVPPLRAALRSYGARRLTRRIQLRTGVVTVPARPGSPPADPGGPASPGPSALPPAPRR